MLTSWPTTTWAAARWAITATSRIRRIDYIPSQSTTIFGKYAIEPFSVTDPQELGAAGGGTFDGGQPGAASGRIQNVGLGASHVFTPNLVLDADFGYTRQRTGAQSTIDLAVGDYGLDVLGIPGTNGVGTQLRRSADLRIWNIVTEQRREHWLLVSRKQQRRQPIPVPRQPVHRRREPELEQGHALDEVWLHLLSLRPEPFSADQRRRRQQSARRLPVPGRHDHQFRQFDYRLQHAGRHAARPAQQRYRHRRSEGDAALPIPIRCAGPSLPATRRISGR